MINILVNWVISALLIIVTAYILPGVKVNGFLSALAVAVVLGLVNAFIRPLLLLLTLPINILTLGLFTFVINALMVMLAAAILKPGFTVANFWWALLFSLVLSILAGLLGGGLFGGVK